MIMYNKDWSYKLNVAQIISFFAHWDFLEVILSFDLDTNFPRLDWNRSRPGGGRMLKRKGLAVGSSRNNTGTKAPERRHAQGWVCMFVVPREGGLGIMMKRR